jgi:hypothetical protein
MTGRQGEEQAPVWKGPRLHHFDSPQPGCNPVAQRHPKGDLKKHHEGSAEARASADQMSVSQLVDGDGQIEGRNEDDEPGQRRDERKHRPQSDLRQSGHQNGRDTGDSRQHHREALRSACDLDQESDHEPDGAGCQHLEPATVEEDGRGGRRQAEAGHGGEPPVNRRASHQRVEDLDRPFQGQTTMADITDQVMELGLFLEVDPSGLDPHEIGLGSGWRAYGSGDRGGGHQILTLDP